MVYPGRPSTGCQTCKTRRIKCDEAKPICGQCKKSKRSCGGAKATVDTIFRYENTRICKKRRIADKSSAIQSTISNELNDICASNADAPPNDIQNQVATIPKSSLHYPREQPPHGSSSYHGITVAPYLPIGEQAVQICFKNIELLHAFDNCAKANNLLLFMAPMYDRSPVDSALRNAVQAVALCAVSQMPSKRGLRSATSLPYGRAISAIAREIQDPVQARSDEALLATILLGWYETMQNTENSLAAWSTHVEGAAALVQLRGDEQFRNPISLNLFRAARTESFTNYIRRGVQPRDTTTWLSDQSENGDDPLAPFVHYLVQLPRLLEQHSAIITKDPNQDLIIAMKSVLGLARELESNLDESTIPEQWQPWTSSFVSRTPEDLENAKAWMGPVHAYSNVYTASVFNKLRSCRLLTAYVVISGAKWMWPSDYASKPEYRRALYIEQQLVNDICASVPCHFEWGGLEISSEDPYKAELQRTALVISGFLLHWPLKCAYASQQISASQKAWIGFRLADVARNCGLQQSAKGVQSRFWTVVSSKK